MIDVPRDLISSEIKNTLFFLLAMLVTSSIAYFYGFFKINNKEEVKISTNYVITVISIFLFTKFVMSMIVYLFGIFLHIEIQNFNFIIFSNLFLDFFLISLLIIYCFIINFSSTKEVINLKKSTIKFDILIGIVSWIVVYPIVTFISNLLDLATLILFKTKTLPDQSAIYFVKSTLHHPMYFTISIIMVVILAPIVEEFIFRGVLQTYLKRFFHRTVAIVIASFIFSIFHFSLFQKLANISILGSIFILGCLLGFLYERQKTLISPIFLHFTVNTITLLSIIFEKGA
jgi:uncharacterized protein